MNKGRLEAFSDGVFSIIITIMVLELKTPTSGHWSELFKPEFTNTFFAYMVSFALVGSFWISHHQIISNVARVTRGLLWRNLFTLFPISLLPLATAWHGAFGNSQAAGITYGLLYIWTLWALANLSHFISKSVSPRRQQQIAKFNRARRGMSLVALLGTIISYWYPPASSDMLIVILIVWNTPFMKVFGIHHFEADRDDQEQDHEK
jgi:uncharacterized membrane protein